MSEKIALKPGDTFTLHGTTVEVLARLRTDDPPDMFGRETFHFWARRRDTGAEGWLTFVEPTEK